ncbi:MAG TPA: DUF4263 domain-containing protein [Panacibacter sp.]|nr:DUF4263 domain-containing protein [Panacibacter sp.]
MSEIWTPPRLAVSHPILFSKEEIEEYERVILGNKSANEHLASKFFSHFPKFLFLGKGQEVKREVNLYDHSGEAIGRVDFFRKNYGTKWWDLIELKSPSKEFVVGSGKHLRPSESVNKAIHQANDYRRWIDEDAYLRAKLLSKGILVYKPQIVVVVGREKGEIDELVLRNLYDRLNYGPIEVKSYNDIYNFAKEQYQSNGLLIYFGQIGNSRQQVSSDILNLPKPENYHPWLTERISIAVVDNYNLGEWKNFKDIKAGDELWNYSSSPESWRALAGRAGIAVVRNGQMIQQILTMMN